MGHQLVVRGGTVIDGSGGPAREADVALDDGRITIVGRVAEPGECEIDATGCLVTPGWVDVHTHYDGQATWDPLLSPSCWHGVTTVVMGNCGVGFAPVRPNAQQWLIQLMEGVEDIPGTALHEGIRWSWESFPEYLDALDTKRVMDVATQVPHGALRAYVMGPRGADHAEQPTAQEVASMGRLAREGIEAGALGFTTSRTVNQKAADGRFTPSLSATRAELVGIAAEIGKGKQGVLAAVADFVNIDEEFAILRTMSDASGRPLSISTMQTDDAPSAWRRLLELITVAAESGPAVRGQVAARAIGVMLGLTVTANPLSYTRGMRKLSALPLSEQVEQLRRSDVRSAILAEADARPPRVNWSRVFELGDPPNYEPSPAESVAARAAVRGISPAVAAYEVMTEDEGRALLYAPFNNWTDGNLDAVREMLTHKYTVPGLGDAGAHCGMVCDASFPTFLLTHWGRDRSYGRLPVTELVKRQARDTAELVGLHDRGEIKPGMKGDLNVIDYDRLALEPPTVAWDLPAHGRRLLQRARGYVATIVAGEVVMRDGEHTGALPGRLVRGAQQPQAGSQR